MAWLASSTKNGTPPSHSPQACSGPPPFLGRGPPAWFPVDRVLPYPPRQASTWFAPPAVAEYFE